MSEGLGFRLDARVSALPRKALPDNLPIQFFETATIECQIDSTPAIRGVASSWNNISKSDSGALNVVINDKYYFLHYFHCVEIIIGVYVFWQEFLPRFVPTHIYFGEQEWNNPNQNDVQKHLLSTCFPLASIIEGPSIGTAIELRNVLYVDRSRAKTDINKFLDPLFPIASIWGRQFTRSVTGHSQIRTATAKLRAGYVRRTPPRCLSQSAEEALFACIVASGYEITIVDFATISFPEQILVCCSFDLLVGMHGNGLTNLLWLPDRAIVIELFPPEAHAYDYQMLAEIRGVPYFGVDGAGNRFYRDWTRVGPVYGTFQQPLTALSNASLFALTRFLICPR